MNLIKLKDFYITSREIGSRLLRCHQVTGDAWQLDYPAFFGLVVHKRQTGIIADSGMPNKWIVTEATSGLLVSTGGTRDAAIAAAIEICESHGVAAYQKQISRRLKTNKITVSPNRLMEIGI